MNMRVNFGSLNVIGFGAGRRTAGRDPAQGCLTPKLEFDPEGE